MILAVCTSYFIAVCFGALTFSFCMFIFTLLICSKYVLICSKLRMPTRNQLFPSFIFLFLTLSFLYKLFWGQFYKPFDQCMIDPINLSLNVLVLEL